MAVFLADPLTDTEALCKVKPRIQVATSYIPLVISLTRPATQDRPSAAVTSR